MQWEDVPGDVRAAMEERMGAPVVDAVTQPYGFSPGVAARLRLADGRRVFVKAVSEAANPDTPEIHRREARVLAALPPHAPAPRLLWTYDGQGWVALGLEDIEGRHPQEPWTRDDLDLVLRCLRTMRADLTPAPFVTEEGAPDWFRTTVNGWQLAHARGEQRLDPWALRYLERLARLESRAPAAAAGDTLLHCDMRADNLLIAGDRVYVLDWPWARAGAWWIDAAGMAPSVAMQGGPAPAEFLAGLDVGAVPAEALDAAVCTIAGYFVVRALEPPPPGLPTVRAFQAAQGRVALAWLRERTGWS